MEISTIKENYKNYKTITVEELDDTINTLIEIVYSGKGEPSFLQACDKALQALNNYRLDQVIRALSDETLNTLIDSID